MSNAQQQQSPAAWTEPPWSGWIETTGDALLILEAARRGLIPRVTRRLVDSERKMITSGSVFVFDEDESGIKRWTDGFFWSPSRILGNFLLYRETDKRGAGHRSLRADQDVGSSEGATFSNDGVSADGQSLSRPKADNTSMGVDKHRERSLVGSLTNNPKFKPDGLMKKTFSLSIGGVAQHLISYYKIEDVEHGRLRSPSSLPELASLDISPEYLDKTHFRNPPKVEVGVDGIPRYRGEADDIENSSPTASSLLTAPLSTNLLSDSRAAEGSSAANKRVKRFDPYGSPPTQKRPRKNTKSSQPDGSPVGEGPVSPLISTSSATPQPAAQSQIQQQLPPLGYVDPINMGMPAPMPPPPGAYPAYAMPPFYAGYPPPPPGHMYGPPPPPHQTSGYPHPAPAPATAGATQIPQQGSSAASSSAASAAVGPVQMQYAPYAAYSPPTAAPMTTTPSQVHGSDPSQAGSGSGQPLPAPASHQGQPQAQVQHPPPQQQHSPPVQQQQPILQQYTQQQPHQPPYYPYYAPPPPHGHAHHPGYAPAPVPVTYHQWPHPHAYPAYPPPPPQQHQHQPPPMQTQIHAHGGYGQPPPHPGVHGAPLPIQPAHAGAGVGVGVQTKGEDEEADDK